MQTCIVKGFVDVPGTKYYYYHGMIRPCNIQPEIVCFDKVDTPDKYGEDKKKTFVDELYTSYENCGWTYSESRDEVDGSYGYTFVGQRTDAIPPNPFAYTTNRMGLAWDTIDLPYDCKIISAKIRLYCTQYSTGETFYIMISNGMPDYPHLVRVDSDYDISKYSGVGGKLKTSKTGWIEIVLNDIGLTWINVGGYTKVMLLDENDFLGIPAIAQEYCEFSWTANIAQLVVTYQERVNKFKVTFDKNDVAATGIMREQEIQEYLKEHLNKNTFINRAGRLPGGR